MGFWWGKIYGNYVEFLKEIQGENFNENV